MSKNEIKLAILKEFLRENNAYELYRYNMLRYYGHNILGLKRGMNEYMTHHYTRMLSAFFDWEYSREGEDFWSKLSHLWVMEIETRKKQWE